MLPEESGDVSFKSNSLIIICAMDHSVCHFNQFAIKCPEVLII